MNVSQKNRVPDGTLSYNSDAHASRAGFASKRGSTITYYYEIVKIHDVMANIRNYGVLRFNLS